MTSSIIDELTEAFLKEMQGNRLDEKAKEEARQTIRNIVWATSYAILGDMNLILDILDEGRPSIKSVEYSNAVRIFLNRFSKDRGIENYKPSDKTETPKGYSIH